MASLEVKDLRIGNYVNAVYEFYDSETDTTELRKTPSTISGIDIDGNLGEGWYYMIHLPDPDVEYFDDIEPIELTEEWLKILGFQVNRGNQSYKIGNTDIVIIEDGTVGFWIEYMKQDITLPLPKYVHELQNLYHAILKVRI